MAHGLNSVVLKRSANSMGAAKSDGKTGGIGSRRIFAPQFKLQVLDSYRNDADCKGNQRATARKYGIHRRQIQKWLQVETNLRNSVMKIKQSSGLMVQQQGHQADPEARKCGPEVALSDHRQRDDTSPSAYSQCSDAPTRTMLPVSSAPAPGVAIAEQRVPYIHIPSQQHSPVAYSESSCSTAPVCISPEAHRVPCVVLSPPRVPLVNTPEPTSDVPNAVTSNADSALDFSTHARNAYRIPDRDLTDYSGDESYLYEPPHIPPPCYPIDLSLKKQHGEHPSCPCDPCTPAPTQIPPPLYYTPSAADLKYDPIPPSTMHPYYLQNNTELNCLQSDCEYEIWDLSTKTNHSLKRKCEVETYSNVSSSADVKPHLVDSLEDPSAKKPVKLFKPYLDDDDYSSSSSSTDSRSYLVKGELCTDSAIKREFLNDCTEHHDNVSLVYYNNNNVIIKSSLTAYPHIVSYYSPHAITSAHDIVPRHDAANVCTKADDFKSAPCTIKQRQSYSLNFKLSAIECYYNDSICRGNQRAVASKYKIHRRQVQKWLKQETELRDRILSYRHNLATVVS